jgi:WD40 repeat protein
MANNVVVALRGNVSRLEGQLAAARLDTERERAARRKAEERAEELSKRRATIGEAVADLNKRLAAARRSGDKPQEDELVRELRMVESNLRTIEDEWRRAQHAPSVEKTFRGHAQPIYALAIDPSGAVFVSGSRDNTAIIWDVASASRLATLKPHHGDVLSVAITPDGKYVVTGSEDKKARLWNRADGKQVAIFAEHTDDVTTVAVTPDGQKVVTGSADTTILIWDLATRKRVGKIEGHKGRVSRVAVTPDGRHIVSGSGDKTLRIWSAATGQQVAKLDGDQGLKGDIIDLAVFLHTRRPYLVSASADNTVRVWELGRILEATKAPPPSYTLNVLERGITSVAVMPGGARVVVALADKSNSVWVWDFAKDTIVSRLEGHEERVLSVAVFPDGRRILTGSTDKSAKTWSFSPDN